MRKMLGVVAVVLMFPVPGSAQVRMLDFEGIGDFVPIGGFYSGVTFFGNAQSLQSAQVSNPACNGSSGFAFSPSGCGALFYYTGQTGSNAGMSLASAFTGGFS